MALPLRGWECRILRRQHLSWPVISVRLCAPIQTQGGYLSGKAVRETLAALGVIASMVFVGLQIRASNVQARAAAYQAIGISTSEFHRGFDARMNRLVTEGDYPDAVKRWTLEDWEMFSRMTKADLRMLETVVLQVEQGLLPSDAINRLGYNWGAELALPGFACLWSEFGQRLSRPVRDLIEGSTPVSDRVTCPVDLNALRDQTILGRPSGE